jgi:hypothetical protein
MRYARVSSGSLKPAIWNEHYAPATPLRRDFPDYSSRVRINFALEFTGSEKPLPSDGYSCLFAGRAVGYPVDLPGCLPWRMPDILDSLGNSEGLAATVGRCNRMWTCPLGNSSIFPVGSDQGVGHGRAPRDAANTIKDAVHGSRASASIAGCLLRRRILCVIRSGVAILVV